MNGDFTSEDDDEIPSEERVFLSRADKIMQKQKESYQELLKKMQEEDNTKTTVEKEDDLLLKINEKLKKKPRSRKAKAKEEPPKVEVAPPTRRSNRRGRRKEDVQENNSSAADVDSTIVNLPAVAKKRLKKFELKTSKEKKKICELNRRILTSCDATSAEDPNISIEIADEIPITLQIHYLSEFHKIIVGENQNFASISSQAAELLKVKSSDIVLCFRDEPINLKDTPKSLSLKSWNVIECIPFKPEEKEADSHQILIRMQSSDCRKKIDMHVHKLEKFGDIMRNYADSHKIPLEDLVFEFDGEKINKLDTPEDLDMESGSCIDVKVVGKTLKSMPVKKTILVVDIEAEETPSQMLDICVLD